MKTIILLAFIGLAMGASVPTPVSVKPVEILKFTNEASPDGSYSYSFETGDGYSREETGRVVYPGEENQYVAVVGSYRYVDPEGKTVDTQYTAGEYGFVPFGSHISETISNNAKSLAKPQP